ncbi:MAG: hypothetical protein HON94_15720 [Methylococcales bacterium]|nr:hypothetical protein [Methylococcales bacterium]
MFSTIFSPKNTILFIVTSLCLINYQAVFASQPCAQGYACVELKTGNKLPNGGLILFKKNGKVLGSGKVAKQKYWRGLGMKVKMKCVGMDRKHRYGGNGVTLIDVNAVYYQGNKAGNRATTKKLTLNCNRRKAGYYQPKNW